MESLSSAEIRSLPNEIGRGTILDRWRLPDGTLYLDNAATRPMLPEVAEEMARLMANNPLNASSQHKYGQKAARMLEGARNFFKSELNVPSTAELIFNSGATEGLNMLLKSAYFADPTKNHIVTVKTEHKAVLDTCVYLETIGAEVTYLDVDEWGRISISELEAVIGPKTCAVCVMRINNETGIIAPTKRISGVCEKMNVLFISDYTQSLGKEDIDFTDNNVDALVASAHKIGGPVGVGFVVLRDKTKWMQLLFGGASAKELRGGTASVAQIATFVKAWDKLLIPSSLDVKKALGLLVQEVSINPFYDCGLSISRSHLIVPVSFPETINFDIVQGSLAFSSGSACLGRLDQVSHVYSALGDESGNLKRLSF